MRATTLLITLTAACVSASGALAAMDKLSQARLAAIEGKHAECAELADKARKEPTAVWHAHHVYATCQFYATDAKKDELSKAEYADGIRKGIDALQFLLDTPGLLVVQEQRASVEFIVEEMNKRITEPAQ